MVLGFTDYLKALKKRQQKTAKFFGKEWTDENCVVSDEAGERFKIGRLTGCFKRLIKAAGLHEIRFHDLRHSNATFLLEYGIRIEEVAAWLGHSSSSTTEKIYAHVHIGIRKRTGQFLDNIMGFHNPQDKKVDMSIEGTLKMLFEVLKNQGPDASKT